MSPNQLMLTSKINSNVEKLTELLENLIQLSKIESNNDITKSFQSIRQILERVKSDIGVKYDKNPVYIEDFKVEQLLIDEKLFEQVLINLIENAFKYGGDDLVITIQTYSTDQHACIQIIDNGPGIACADLDRIFERFFRVQGETLSIIDGSGLGLSIVKHIINKHNGNNTATSEPNCGACFTITLPKEKLC